MINELKDFVEIYLNRLANMNINSQVLNRNRSIILDFIFAYEDHNKQNNKYDNNI